MKHYSLFSHTIYSFRKVFQYRGKGFLAAVVSYLILGAAVPFLGAAFPGFVIDLISNGPQIGSILLLTGLYGGALALLSVIVRYSEEKFFNELFLMRLAVGGELPEKLMKMDYQRLESGDGKKKAERALLGIVGGDNFGIEAMGRDAVYLISGIVGFLLYSFVTAGISVWALILLLACQGVGVYLRSRKLLWVRNYKEEWAKTESKERYLKREAMDIKNAKDIRLYRMKGWLNRAFSNLIAERMKWYKKESFREFGIQASERLLWLLSYGAVYYFLYRKVRSGMSVGDFTLYIGVTAGLGTWIRQIFERYNRMQENSVVMDDYRSFLEAGEGIEGDLENSTDNGRETGGGNADTSSGKNGGGQRLLSGTKEIRFEDVCFTYPDADVPALSHFNLTIRKGEKIALVGRNGAGKTTLVKLLCGLYRPDSGRILLDGMDISNIGKSEWFREFSVVFQDVFAFAFSIEENVSCELKEKTDQKKLWSALESSGLAEKIASLPAGADSVLLKDLNEAGIQLSGGELQKLMLARALYKGAPLLVLDEPAAALDPVAEEEMYLKYRELTKHKTSLFISHRLSSTRFCDRVVFLENGTAAEVGSHEELMNRNGGYARMFQIQALYYRKEEAECF